MRVLVGTSGYSYKEWRGGFYPEKLAASQMLACYAERFPTVEINNTFYRMPRREVLARWVAQVPQSFRFAVKAPRRITHERRLKDAGDAVTFLFDAVAALGDGLGPVLFQLPPFLRKDLSRLRGFLATLPAARRAALEFRHESWFDDAVYDALRERGVALCVADSADRDAPRVATADWGYVRLRRGDYDDAALAAWADCIRAQPWRDAYVYLKHDEGRAPELAARLADRIGRTGDQ